MAWVLKKSTLIFLALFVATWVLAKFGNTWLEAPGLAWAIEYPKTWVLPLKDYVSAAMKWLVEDASFGLFTFTEFTRAIAWLIEQPYEFVRAVLAT
ncbi:MAG: ABC transporter permease, partial [Rhodobacteraceae bacterium]|nr:ABC transporter permease [Paracoccaceae bacterium]